MTATNPKPRPFTTFGERSVRRTLVRRHGHVRCDSKPQFAGGQCPPANCADAGIYLPSAASTVVCFGAIVVSVSSLSVCLVHRDRDRRTRARDRVAVRAERERAEQAVLHVRREQLRDDVRARAVRSGDRVEHRLRGLAAVDCVRVDRLARERPGEQAVDELLRLALERVDRLAGDGHVHARPTPSPPRRSSPAS